MPDDAPMLCDVAARCVSTGRSAAVFTICAPVAALLASGRLRSTCLDCCFHQVEMTVT